MLFMCTSRFDLKEEQRAMINEYLSYEEVQADREEKDTKASEFDPISDNEEDDEGDLIQIQQISQVPGGKSQGKQQRSIASMPEGGCENEDDEPTLPLPQQRMSGRVQKRPRLLEGYEVQ